MKKNRIKMSDLKEKLTIGDVNAYCYATCFLYNTFRMIYSAFYLILGILALIQKLYLFSVIFLSTSFLVFVIRKKFKLFLDISLEIVLRRYGRFGPVITKKDWERIKKKNPKLYRKANSKASLCHCYDYSRKLAMYLKNAKLMYCATIHHEDGKTAHAVILKNGYVYDTNLRQHVELEYYVELLDVIVYRTFSKSEYQDEDFFDNIKDDFASWCRQNDVTEYFSHSK